MSDDWQVVEEAFQAVLDSYAHGDDRYRDRWIGDVREGIARLREREAQLAEEYRIEIGAYEKAEQRAEAAEAREVEYHNIQQALKARVKELEAVLREITTYRSIDGTRRAVRDRSPRPSSQGE